MCGRYQIAQELSEDLLEIIDALNRAGKNVKTGEIFPNDTVPVIANNKRLEHTPFAMTWGYRLPDGKLMINARSETASQKPMFRDGMMQRRCLLPASYYYEWEERDGQKIKHAIRAASGDMIYLAGIYRLEGNAPRVTILTREPADSIAYIHNRMPVIMPKEAIGDWLNIRYSADDVLRAALTDVQAMPAN